MFGLYRITVYSRFGIDRFIQDYSLFTICFRDRFIQDYSLFMVWYRQVSLYNHLTKQMD